jgi:hypothetical protein
MSRDIYTFVLVASRNMKWMLTIALILSSVTYYPAKVTAQTRQAATTKQPVQPTKGRTPPNAITFCDGDLDLGIKTRCL